MSVTLVTNYGKIKIEIYCDTIQKASFNFLALAASGYYDNTLFHRNIKGLAFKNILRFMIQGGDPTNTGKGGESVWGHPFIDEFHPDYNHDKRGVVSMANNGPDTNGSQFFITYGVQTHLNSKYTIFGQVIDGFEVLDALEKIPVAGKKNRPVNDIKLESIIIHANPLAS